MKRSFNFEYKDDYVQSANTLFHFMKQRDFLIKALDNCALFPRYCIEDVEYMGLTDSSNNQIKEIAVLQKCFCDIPLHKLTEQFDININKDCGISNINPQNLDDETFNTHTGCYGEYAIGFEKAWCVKHGLQPVLYVNSNSELLQDLGSMFKYVMEKDDVDEILVYDLLLRMAYMKPLHGRMRRTVDGNTIIIDKNFHDEKEWRFIPEGIRLRDSYLEMVIAKKNIQDSLLAINSNIELPVYSSIWLKFDYEDIKYIIVPNQSERLSLIKHIMDIPEDRVTNNIGKCVLISKILVLDDIRKDW